MKVHIYDDKSFKAMIREFMDRIKEILDNNLLSVIISGSVALEDYIYSKGDIDFFVVTKHDLSVDDYEKIIKLHERLRAGELGLLGTLLEGVYCPLPMMQEPRYYTGLGCYIGTRRKGWKQISKSAMSNIDYLTISQYGKTVYGEDITKKIFKPSYDELRETIIAEIKNNLKHSEEINDIYFSLHLLYFATRSLYTFFNYDIISKGKSCDWFIQKYPDSQWVPFIKYTSQYRYPLDKIEKEQIDGNYIIKNAPLLLEHIYSIIKDSDST
ncbi:nucleotidyltransferase domain-containing protein [Brassicibacter mesophilus]|uniref:nucleotidyltransferase domain-containing protein n=1 Tax=Brassicibacter mesophilus TaxID=745119 RepID=UPI003D2465C6